ncbi:MAG: hypothetical protein EPO39_06370 [Candidatus Manganitrophaceae bacterium]|nr:MAG: hypothetical protein EPO39_06370 [Candidatus Manganitrophaceae bacterium]
MQQAKQKTKIKHTAILLSLIYLFLSSLMMIEGGRHAMEHGRGGHHAAQHASVTCAWMCAASTFIDSGDQNLRQIPHPSFQNQPVFIERFIGDPTLLSYHIRPPPFSFFQ